MVLTRATLCSLFSWDGAEGNAVSKGAGLGLPLTKALVEANRAFFSIKSKKNEGTLIEIAFPPARLLSRDPLSA